MFHCNLSFVKTLVPFVLSLKATLFENRDQSGPQVGLLEISLKLTGQCKAVLKTEFDVLDVLKASAKERSCLCSIPSELEIYV